LPQSSGKPTQTHRPSFETVTDGASRGSSAKHPPERGALSVGLTKVINLEVYPYFKDSNAYVQVLENPPEDRIKDGKVDVMGGPGIGVTLAKDRLKNSLWDVCH
jgi:hypothetical protein